MELKEAINILEHKSDYLYLNSDLNEAIEKILEYVKYQENEIEYYKNKCELLKEILHDFKENTNEI